MHCGFGSGRPGENPRLAAINRVPSRVVAFFLAFVLFWSGLSTIEAPRALVQPSHEQQHTLTQAGGPLTLNDGSVEDHHLDDQPSQALSDPSVETFGLLPAPPRCSAPTLAMIEPHAFVLAVAGPPFLDGPLRPPRSEAV